MSDLPKKMWMDEDGIVWPRRFSQNDTRIPVLVYPADQAPEPVAWLGPIGQLMLAEFYRAWCAKYPEARGTKLWRPLYEGFVSESAIRRPVGAGDGNTHVAEYLTNPLESAIREQVCSDWVVAMAHALGMDSKFNIPIVPSANEFRKLFAAIRASERRKLLNWLDRNSVTYHTKEGLIAALRELGDE